MKFCSFRVTAFDEIIRNWDEAVGGGSDAKMNPQNGYTF